MAQLVKNLPAVWETWVRSLGWKKISWRREKLTTPVFSLENYMAHKESDTTERLSLGSPISIKNFYWNFVRISLKLYIIFRENDIITLNH